MLRMKPFKSASNYKDKTKSIKKTVTLYLNIPSRPLNFVFMVKRTKNDLVIKRFSAQINLHAWIAGLFCKGNITIYCYFQLPLYSLAFKCVLRVSLKISIGYFYIYWSSRGIYYINICLCNKCFISLL